MVHPKNSIKFEIILSENVSVTLWITQMDHIPILNNKWAGKVCAFSIWKSKSHAQSCLCNPMDCSLPGSSAHRDSPGKNTEVGCHFLLQGIFPTQVSNSRFLHCRQTLYHWATRKVPKYVCERYNSNILYTSPVSAEVLPLVWLPQVLVSLDHSSSTFMFSLT